MANEYKLSYTAADINTRLGKIDSLAEKSEVPKKLSDLTNDSDFATENYVQNYAQPKGDYALKNEIPTDYLTEIPEEYITENELNSKGYLTEHQSLEGLATEEWVEEKFNVENGEDGFSPVATVTQTASGAVISITDKNGTTTATVTNGEDGYTPVKGTDYYTEEDKIEFETYIATELAKRGQLKPEFANSIEECTDITKLYVLPDGYIYAYMLTEGAAYTNLADPTSADWLTNKCFSTSSISDASGGIISNHIPAKAGDVIRVKGLDLYTAIGGSRPRIRLYNGTTVADAGGLGVYYMDSGYVNIANDITTITLAVEALSTELSKAFDSIRLNGTLLSGYTVNDIIITINEEIVEGVVSGYAWANTGHAFVTSDKVNGDVNINVESNVIFVNSVEECINPDKLYVVLPDGFIHAYMLVETETEGYKNWIPYSTVSGGDSIYNETGYKIGYRLNSSAVEKELADCIVFGFIPVTKNSVLRIKNFANACYGHVPAHNGNYIHLYDSSYTLLTASQQGYTPSTPSKGIGSLDDNGIYTVTLSEILDSDSVAFVQVSTLATTSGGTATDADASKFIITVDQEIINGTTTTTKEYKWVNTGHAFIPADYEDRINDIKNIANNNTSRIKALEANVTTGTNIPDYWLSHLQEKAHQIQLAMEDAGRNKSAFLWYTDAHWVNGNSKMSPMLLNYLYRNTSMNKVNFGGDIIGDRLLETREAMSYLYEWRRMIKDLPNHHSVLGNHDNFRSDNVDYEDDNFVYSFLIAPEESADMVMGGDFYYYIDNPCEKTRYLYLDSGRYSLSDGETAFVIDALKNTPSGWHIVVISHIWFQYSAVATPTVGSMNGSMQKLLNLFDAYNSRQSGSVTMASVTKSYDFTNCGGKVEFCIGGHIHVDYDITSTGGIPVIITTADANQNRVPDSEVDSGTIGTITESAVFGIIADYNSNKITVVGVGRGTDRVISY